MYVEYVLSADAPPPYVGSEPLNKMKETLPVKLCAPTLGCHHGCTAFYQGRSIMQHTRCSDVLASVVCTFKR